MLNGVLVIVMRDQTVQLPAVEQELVHSIKEKTSIYNRDNISRTNAYYDFYKRHPEIRWSFLAHMVSRNAGWNMCDLKGKWLPKVLNKKQTNRLFLTYERANWYIFHDAFPQLLLYHYSTKNERPMFHLLKYFHVSSFMKDEWNIFWTEKDQERLMAALIINEQNVIQKPVIQHPLYKKRVFHSLLFSFQDCLHFSSVLFPTVTGKLYGASVNQFRSVNHRIDLGKRLASILFHHELYPLFLQFAENTSHTGSRTDYEQYFPKETGNKTPLLREVYPVIKHHVHNRNDWLHDRKVKGNWFTDKVVHRHPVILTDWYNKKQKRLHRLILLKELIYPYK